MFHGLKLTMISDSVACILGLSMEGIASKHHATSHQHDTCCVRGQHVQGVVSNDEIENTPLLAVYLGTISGYHPPRPSTRSDGPLTGSYVNMGPASCNISFWETVQDFDRWCSLIYFHNYAVKAVKSAV